MFIKCLKVGPIGTNCYILCDTISSQAAVIDPGADAGRIAAAVADTGCELKYILLTHGHWDHQGAVEALREQTGAPVAAFAGEEALIADPSLCLFDSFGTGRFTPAHIDNAMDDGGTLALGNLELKFIATPGHTSGSCCILCQDCLFSGDTLFRDDSGRTDLPTGSASDMLLSLRRLAALPGEYRVFPGHEELTTMSYERENNILLREDAR
jgi:hydroxyacylglutathione hydrolase